MAQRSTNKLVLLDEVVACLYYDIVFIAENGGDFVRDPLLHQVNIDLLNVDLLIELRWKFGSPQAFLVNAHCHVGGAAVRVCGSG